MNKTTSINLGGFFFHIDEDAYQRLSTYLTAVKKSLTPEGRDEIIKDIEGRIAELFQEKLGTTKQVITINEVEEVIVIMGQPEDYKIEDDAPKSSSKNYESVYYPTKKLYRDKEEALLGGVLSGMSHYFSIEAIWLRIIFILGLLLSFGTLVLAYIIFWILLPEAISTSQKLEMKGQPITISNIEKKVKEGYSEFTEKINNLNAQKFTNSASNVFSEIIKGIGKAVGFFIILFATITLFGIVIASLVLLFSNFLPEVMLHDNIQTPFQFDVPLWIQGLLLLLSIGIPLFAFVILGIKLMLPNSKSLNSYAKYTLIGLWIISVISCNCCTTFIF